MIAQIKGIIVEKTDKKLILSTNSGVGYEVFVTPKLLDFPLSEEVTISTYCHVKEDAWVLFGFESDSQKKMFIKLLSVDGVGPKTAFTIISTKSLSELTLAIVAKDVKIFEDVSGVGKKTAARIILELSSFLRDEVDINSLLHGERKLDATAIETLTTLGFSKKSVISALMELNENISFDESIKQALKKLSSTAYE